MLWKTFLEALSPNENNKRDNMARDTTSTKVKVDEKKKKRSRGRPTGAKPSDYQSILEKISWEQDKFAADCANSLPELHKLMLDLAKGKGDFEKAGIKDRVGATRYCLELANNILDDYYEAEAESLNEKNDSSEDEEVPKKEDTSNNTPLIDMSAWKEG